MDHEVDLAVVKPQALPHGDDFRRHRNGFDIDGITRLHDRMRTAEASTTTLGTEKQPEMCPVAAFIALRQEALDDAAGPGGSARVELAAEVGWVGVAEGTWRCSDAGAVLAERLGLGAGGPVHTVRADIGILQQRLIAEACGAILRGEVEAAVVVGGEARARDRAIARRGGVPTARRMPTASASASRPAALRWASRVSPSSSSIT